ncbi:hypothetical protein [Sphingomonas sp.]|uniref:hypothetical protein n=1 Tax=Sphingomonas sp. TaxID=28214 RepID=UPI0037516365
MSFCKQDKQFPKLRLLPLIIQGYVIGTLVAALVLHVAVSIIAPGDGGTLLALGSGIMLYLLLLIVGVIGLIAFPLAAMASWPLRGLVIDRPATALSASASVGGLIGALLTATEFQVGPGDFYSGPIVGLTYGIVWFLVVRYAFGKPQLNA